MYLYKLKIDLFYPDRIYRLPDNKVTCNFINYFSGDNIQWWKHRNDDTWEIDYESEAIDENLAGNSN